MEAVASPETAPGGTGAVLRRLLALCWRHRAACIQVLALQGLLLSLGLAGLGFTGVGIDFLRHRLEAGAPAPHWPLGFAPPPGWPPAAVLVAIAAAVLGSALLRGSLSWLAGVTLARLVHRRVVGELQTAVFARLQQLSFGFFDRQDSGAIINRATGDIGAVRMFVDTVLIQSLVTLLSLTVYVTYMVAIHPALTAACLVTLPFLWVLAVTFSRIVHPEYQRTRRLFDTMILNLAENVQGAGVVKGFALEREMDRRFRADNQAVRTQQRRIFLRVSTFSPTVDLLTQVNLVILLVYGGRLVIDGDLPLGTGLVVFAGLLQQFSNQVSTTAQIANGVQESLAGAGRVFEILDAPPAVASPASPTRLPHCRGSVELDNVSFDFGGGRSVLHGVSIRVQPGECIALVGETGSGKSALLSLIPRFYDPSSGTVRIDGHDVRTLDLQELRHHVGLVFQESFLFNDTVTANLCFGRPDAARDRMIAAARAAQAHDFIQALPQGYETVLGEGGVDLSGGQRQRLAIARALILDPAILLLDDPTASIDPETEHEVLAAVDRAIQGRTTFIVAHRLSTLRRADRILVLERGRIVQSGTHDELMAATGPYQRAARVQLEDSTPAPDTTRPVWPDPAPEDWP